MLIIPVLSMERKGSHYVRIHFPKMLRQSLLNRQSVRVDIYKVSRCPDIVGFLNFFLNLLPVSRGVFILWSRSSFLLWYPRLLTRKRRPCQAVVRSLGELFAEHRPFTEGVYYPTVTLPSTFLLYRRARGLNWLCCIQAFILRAIVYPRNSFQNVFTTGGAVRHWHLPAFGRVADWNRCIQKGMVAIRFRSNSHPDWCCYL